MMRPPGPFCSSQLGPSWVDAGTSGRHRSQAPAEQQAARQLPPPAERRPLSPPERQLLTALDGAGIQDPRERAMFLAQMSHESQDFHRLRENLGYSAVRLRQVFPNRFKTDADAQSVVAAGQEAVAERIYGGRAELGNRQPGDGARFIGRGYVHLTGRANYEAAGQVLSLDLANHPEMAEEPAIAARVAVWFWRTHALSAPAQRGDVRRVTLILNGGVNGLADRQHRFQRYCDALGVQDTTAMALPHRLP